MNVAAHAFPDPSDEQRGMLVAGALWVMSVCKYSHAWARPRTFCGRELDIIRRWPGAGLRVGRDLRRCIGASWTLAQAGFPVHRNEFAHKRWYGRYETSYENTSVQTRGSADARGLLYPSIFSRISSLPP